MFFLSAFFVLLFTALTTVASDKCYSVTPNDDGGYTLTIIPGNDTNTVPRKLRLLGHGVERTDPNGFYYPAMAIIDNEKTGDIGYAWVDAPRERIYLNCYWIAPPDSLVPSNVNGCYEIRPPENAPAAAREGQINVTITGEVVSPGEYVLAPGATLGDLLDLAVMNPAPFWAAKKHVIVRRQTDGEGQETQHDCSTPQSPGRSFPLQNGDTILVPCLL
ncbi:hypothetical protein J6U76_00160 [bacterium]|nr:hypothetical protein [bacterium]MBP1589645.1 hypothetical protein [Kiritimatiellia bacterium]